MSGYRRGMHEIAKVERRYDVRWGVVNPGNALCHSIHKTRREALAERKARAGAYTVIRVTIIPHYDEVGK